MKKLAIIVFLPVVLFYAIVTSDSDKRIALEDAQGADDSVGDKTPSDPPTTRPARLRTWSDTVGMFNGEGVDDSVLGRRRAFLVTWAIFGALHFLAWNAEMPTSAEDIIWRFAAAFLTVLPFATVLATVTTMVLNLEDGGFWDTFIFASITFGLFLHPLIRAIVIVDALALLRQLPDTAYRDLSWSDVIPSL